MQCGGRQGSAGVKVRLGLELAREREGRADRRTGGLRVHVHKDPSIGGWVFMIKSWQTVLTLAMVRLGEAGGAQVEAAVREAVAYWRARLVVRGRLARVILDRWVRAILDGWVRLFLQY